MKKIQKTVVLTQLGSHDFIRQSDFHSIDNGESIRPIASPETIGDIPANFSKDRSFWRITEIK